ncbi:MAG: ABC transporter ATP-binding protein [Verrucomicrobiota bacterium]
MALLEIEDLTVEFGAGPRAVRAVDGVSLSLAAGRVLGVVGESGSGKSVTALSIARLLPAPPARYVAGRIRLDGREVLGMSPRELRGLRGGVVSYVFQEPGLSLNPVIRVGGQIREALEYHRPQRATDAEVVRLLRWVGMADPENRRQAYPHELSGGMQQRVMIALALASEPRLLVADEPTTALDVTLQAQVFDLLRNLRDRLGLAVLLITHNLGLVAELADEVAVMYAGQVVEQGPVADVLARPGHPYTRGLMESVPALGAGTGRLRGIPGQVPVPGAYPAGCRFHPRCPQALPACRTVPPALEPFGPGRRVRCPVLAPPPS